MALHPDMFRLWIVASGLWIGAVLVFYFDRFLTIFRRIIGATPTDDFIPLSCMEMLRAGAPWSGNGNCAEEQVLLLTVLPPLFIGALILAWRWIVAKA